MPYIIFTLFSKLVFVAEADDQPNRTVKGISNDFRMPSWRRDIARCHYRNLPTGAHHGPPERVQ